MTKEELESVAFSPELRSFLQKDAGMKPIKHLKVPLTEELTKWVERKAKEQDRSQAYIIREALEEKMRKEK